MTWKTIKLDELCEIQSGLWKGKKPPFEKVFVLRNTNFTDNGELSFDDVAELEVESNQLKKRMLRYGDIILEKSGGGPKKPVGRVCVFENENKDYNFSLSNFTAYLRIKNKEICYYRFLYKFLYYLYISGKTEPMQRYSTAIRNLQMTQYKNIDVPLPPLKEQKRIVAKLDTVFTETNLAIQSIEQKESELSTLIESVIRSNVESYSQDIDWVALTDVCEEIYAGGDAPKDRMSAKKTESFPIPIFSNGIGKAGLYGYTNFSRANKPSVTVSARGTIGHIELRNEPFVPIVRLIVLTPKQSLLGAEYLKYVLKTLDILSSGSSIPQLTVPMLKDRKIPVPSLKNQQSIVDNINNAIEEIKKISNATSRQIKEYQSLKSAFLTQELSGEAA